MENDIRFQISAEKAPMLSKDDATKQGMCVQEVIQFTFIVSNSNNFLVCVIPGCKWYLVSGVH